VTRLPEHEVSAIHSCTLAEHLHRTVADRCDEEAIGIGELRGGRVR
jgi:hypothetical protein